MSWIGATWLLFLFYIVSLGFLLRFDHFAKIGLGNRFVIGSSCVMGMGLLGQVAGFSGIGDQDIHLLDQSLIVPIFFCGNHCTAYHRRLDDRQPSRIVAAAKFRI